MCLTEYNGHHEGMHLSIKPGGQEKWEKLSEERCAKLERSFPRRYEATNAAKVQIHLQMDIYVLHCLKHSKSSGVLCFV